MQQVPRPRQTAMLELLTQFTGLSELDIQAAPGCQHEGMYAALPCLATLFEPVPSAAHLTKLHIRHVPLQTCIAENLAAGLRCTSQLLDLNFTGFCCSQGRFSAAVITVRRGAGDPADAVFVSSTACMGASISCTFRHFGSPTTPIPAQPGSGFF